MLRLARRYRGAPSLMASLSAVGLSGPAWAKQGGTARSTLSSRQGWERLCFLGRVRG